MPMTPMLTTPTVRDMLLMGGVGQYNAVLSIPYMFFMARTTEPYAQGVQQLIKGLQRLLNKRGASLKVDGGLGHETLAELKKYAGPRWYDKTWCKLYQEVIAGKRWPGWIREGRQPGNLNPIDEAAAATDLVSSPIAPPLRTSSLGATSFIGDMFATPLPWVAAGGLALWYFGSKRSRRK